MENLYDPTKVPSAVEMKPLEMNTIHFAGSHTPLTPDILRRATK